MITPLAGIILGELIHEAIMAMTKNGFKWHEDVFVTISNPIFLINNGLKSRTALKTLSRLNFKNVNKCLCFFAFHILGAYWQQLMTM